VDDGAQEKAKRDGGECACAWQHPRRPTILLAQRSLALRVLREHSAEHGGASAVCAAARTRVKSVCVSARKRARARTARWQAALLRSQQRWTCVRCPSAARWRGRGEQWKMAQASPSVLSSSR
jgi:hypothetical protein